MLRLSPLWIALACAIATNSTANAGPGIWRCGNSYSDTPCEGGKPVGAPSTPSAEDRRQRDEGTRRDQLAAERMQRERLEFEAQPRKAVVIALPAREGSTSTQPAGTFKSDKKKKSARPKKPDAFTASYADPAEKPAGKKK